jgi:hypothetical protein
LSAVDDAVGAILHLLLLSLLLLLHLQLQLLLLLFPIFIVLLNILEDCLGLEELRVVVGDAFFFKLLVFHVQLVGLLRCHIGRKAGAMLLVLHGSRHLNTSHNGDRNIGYANRRINCWLLRHGTRISGDVWLAGWELWNPV